MDLFYLILAPIVFLVLLWVSRCFTRPKYRRGLLARIGGFPRRSGDRRCFWIHAVSVGEVLIAEPLVEALKKKYPDWDVAISVSTYTGREVALKRFADDLVFYYPLDLTPVVSVALERLRPTVVILLELELWPNFLLAAGRRDIPVLVANGRMTERSCRGYRRLGGLGRLLFRQVRAYTVQNDEYAARFRSVGLPAEMISTLGNLKYDRRPPASAERSEETRAHLGWSRETGAVILVAGCTHPGEELLLCRMLTRWKEIEPRLKLVLAPRHIERLAPEEIQRWESPFPVVPWSALEKNGLGEQILLIDTVGELERFYGAADLVVVGGSFVPHGGHNLLEPTRLGKATLFGPHHHNFKEEANYLLRHEAALCVSNAGELDAKLTELLRQPEECRKLGQKARAATLALQGVVERHLDWLERVLPLLLKHES